MVRLVPLNMFKHSSDFLRTVPRECFFRGYILFFAFVFVVKSCLFLAALWSPARKELTSWLSCVLCFLVFVSLSHMCLNPHEVGTVKHV